MGDILKELELDGTRIDGTTLIYDKNNISILNNKNKNNISQFIKDLNLTREN